MLIPFKTVLRIAELAYCKFSTIQAPKGFPNILYGVCSGIKSYMGLFGNQVTVPAMKANYIDVKE